MDRVRLLGRLDIKNNSVIKGIHLEGLRKIGDPAELATKYYQSGIDEILFVDSVAAYYDRNSLVDVIAHTASQVFVPITVAGGLRSIEDIQRVLSNGADKVAINTQATRDRNFLKEAVQVFGSQSIICSLVVKSNGQRAWELYTDNGREPSGIDALEWIDFAQECGVGELMVTSIDRDGTRKGFDEEFLSLAAERASVPLIACSGAGKVQHLGSLCRAARVDAIAVASMLHYGLSTIPEMKETLRNSGRVTRL